VVIAGSVVGGLFAITLFLYIFLRFYRLRKADIVSETSQSWENRQSKRVRRISPFTVAKGLASLSRSKGTAHIKAEGRIQQLEIPFLSSSEIQEQRRHERQQELYSQMKEIQAEIKALQGEAAEWSSSGRDVGGVEAAADYEAVVEQLNQSQAHVAHLQSQLQTAWAMGLSDEPPPAYKGSTPRNSQ
jgi:hypothetical protein